MNTRDKDMNEDCWRCVSRAAFLVHELGRSHAMFHQPVIERLQHDFDHEVPRRGRAYSPDDYAAIAGGFWQGYWS